MAKNTNPKNTGNSKGKQTRADKRRANDAYAKAQDALDNYRGDPESDEFHRLNNASHAAKKNASWARRHRWI